MQGRPSTGLTTCDIVETALGEQTQKTLTASQRKRVRRKRAKARKKAQAALAKSSGEQDVNNAVKTIPDAQAALLLSQAHASISSATSKEEQVKSAFDALSAVLKVQHSRGGDDLVAKTLEAVKQSKEKMEAQADEEKRAAKRKALRARAALARERAGARANRGRR
jgi:enoyl reductase-like protein